MTLRQLTFTLLCVSLIYCFTSCSDDSSDIETEQTIKENDWLLNGTWQLKHNNGNEVCNASEITFRPDGSGTMEGKEFKWYTRNSQLYLCFNDGITTQSSYYVLGATLSINKLGVYVTEFSGTGTWYAADAMSEFTGNTFCYHFNENGEGIKYTFDYIGLTAKTNFKWQRLPNGINIINLYGSEEKECSFTDNMMIVNGEGTFTSTLPFYGKWKAVDCEKGLIYEDDDNFSTLDITIEDNKNYFVCRYKTNVDNNFKETLFQGDVKFISSHQTLFNDQQLFILKDLSGNGDAKALEFRFLFYPPRKKVYLDLSEDMKSKRFVRYELM